MPYAIFGTYLYLKKNTACLPEIQTCVSCILLNLATLLSIFHEWDKLGEGTTKTPLYLNLKQPQSQTLTS